MAMTTNGLERRVDALEDAMHRHRVRQIAEEYGVDADQVLAGEKRLSAYVVDLRRRGVPEHEIRTRMITWAAADVGVDADELRAEWERVRAAR